MKKIFLAIIIMLTIINVNVKAIAETPVKNMFLINKATISSQFPSTFDLRESGKVSTVKNQGESNACWAFATMDSLQSSLLPSANYDFSENNLKNLNGFDYQTDGGGEKSMSVAYLASWQGPVNEDDDPFIASSVISPSNLKVQKHVQDVYFIPSMTSGIDTDQIKKALMDYGAVFTNIKWNSYYYNDMYKSYYYNASGIVNHSITIVGWDDNFDKNNFNFTTPINGAFIVKDSRGSSFGENGYYYISYFDAMVGTSNACFTAESINNYNNIYQYDYLGYVDKLGYTTENPYFSNVFNSSKDENLTAVSFYTLYPDCQFEIKVYNNLHEKPNDGILIGEKTGTIQLPGYHTIKLNNSIALKKGDKFSIVVGFKNVNSTEAIAIECPEYGYSSKATANSNESFVSVDGTNWEDIALKISNTNVCLKAFTVNIAPSTKPAMDKENIIWNIDESSVVIPYTTNIAFNTSISNIKGKILVSTNNTVKYLPLGDEDTVEIGSNGDSNKLIIHFANIMNMPSIKLRVLENTLINLSTGNLQDTVEETPEYKIENKPSLVSENISINAARTVITIPYNNYIEWNVEKSKIKQNILISIDDNPFTILGENDSIKFNVLSNQIIINLGKAIQGEKVKIKVLKNTIKNMLPEATGETYIQDQDQETLSINIKLERPQMQKSGVSVDSFKKIVTIPYNCKIQPVDKYTNLASNVLISQNEKDFYPLLKSEMVTIGSGNYANHLIITLDSMLVGDTFRIKVLSNTLKNTETADNQIQDEFTDSVSLENTYSEFKSQSEIPILNSFPPEKEFKIKFSNSVNRDTLLGNIVIVRNDTMKKEQITYDTLAVDNTTILIKHEKPFEKNITYTLYIGNHIKTSNGYKSLKNGIKFSFIIKD